MNSFDGLTAALHRLKTAHDSAMQNWQKGDQPLAEYWMRQVEAEYQLIQSLESEYRTASRGNTHEH